MVGVIGKHSMTLVPSIQTQTWKLHYILDKFIFLQYWLPWYSWNIVESGIKHHNPNSNVKIEQLIYMYRYSILEHYFFPISEFCIYLLLLQAIKPQHLWSTLQLKSMSGLRGLRLEVHHNTCGQHYSSNPCQVY